MTHYRNRCALQSVAGQFSSPLSASLGQQWLYPTYPETKTFYPLHAPKHTHKHSCLQHLNARRAHGYHQPTCECRDSRNNFSGCSFRLQVLFCSLCLFGVTSPSPQPAPSTDRFRQTTCMGCKIKLNSISLFLTPLHSPLLFVLECLLTLVYSHRGA